MGVSAWISCGFYCFPGNLVPASPLISRSGPHHKRTKDESGVLVASQTCWGNTKCDMSVDMLVVVEQKNIVICDFKIHFYKCCPKPFCKTIIQSSKQLFCRLYYRDEK